MKGLINIGVSLGLMVLLVIGVIAYCAAAGSMHDAFKSWQKPPQTTQTSPSN